MQGRSLENVVFFYQRECSSNLSPLPGIIAAPRLPLKGKGWSQSPHFVFKTQHTIVFLTPVKTHSLRSEPGVVSSPASLSSHRESSPTLAWTLPAPWFLGKHQNHIRGGSETEVGRPPSRPSAGLGETECLSNKLPADASASGPGSRL